MTQIVDNTVAEMYSNLRKFSKSHSNIGKLALIPVVVLEQVLRIVDCPADSLVSIYEVFKNTLLIPKDIYEEWGEGDLKYSLQERVEVIINNTSAAMRQLVECPITAIMAPFKIASKIVFNISNPSKITPYGYLS